MLDCLANVPLSGFRAGQFIQQSQLVIPGQLCKHLLHKFRIRPGLRKSTHVLEITWRKSFHLWKGRTQILGEAFNHFGTPPLFSLADLKELQEVLRNSPRETLPWDRAEQAITHKKRELAAQIAVLQKK